MIEVRKTAVVERDTPVPEGTREMNRYSLREDLYGANKENITFAEEMPRCPQCGSYGEHKMGCSLQVKR